MSQTRVVLPVSTKDSYDPSDIVDFELAFENSAMVANSLRVEGVVEFSNVADDVRGKDYNYDPLIGAHGLFSTLNLSTSNGGSIDNNPYYPIVVKQKTVALMDEVEIGCRAKNVCELRCSNDTNTKYVIRGGMGDGEKEQQSFSIKPMCGFNSATNHISYQKTGLCRLSLRVSKNFLYGSDVDADSADYVLKDLKVVYRTIPLEKSHDAPVIMRGYVSYQNELQNSNVSLSQRVAGIVDGVSVSFKQNDLLNNKKYNQSSLDYLPVVERVQFNYNDNNNEFIQFVLEKEQDILFQAIKSWDDTPLAEYKNCMKTRLLRGQGKNYMVGLKLPQIDLSRSTMNITIESGITTNLKFASFLVFHMLRKL